MIGPRCSPLPHSPISLLSVPPIFGHSFFSFSHQWKLFFSGSHIILWHLNVNRFWFSQAGLSFHIYLSICFTCPDIWQLYSQRLHVSTRCNMSSDQHTITVIKSGQTVLTGHSHNHKKLCQIKPSNWSQSKQREWGMSLEILICLDHRAQLAQLAQIQVEHTEHRSIDQSGAGHKSKESAHDPTTRSRVCAQVSRRSLRTIQ